MSQPQPLLPRISFAKNPAHEKHLRHYEGKVKGRYLRAFLAGAAFQGGPGVRAAIERELDDPDYMLDEWYPVQDMVLIFDRAARAGIDLARMGGLVLPAYQRAHPEQFEGKSVEQGFDVMEQGFREHTTYGGVSPAHEVQPGRVRLFRTNSPVPCHFFAGVIVGLFKVYGVEGTVEEVTCQWEGAESCCFEASWKE